MPDTMAASRVEATSTMAGAAADKAASNEKTKYSAHHQTHIFVPVSVEAMGSWNVDSINFVSTVGKKLAEVSGDPLETSYLFQRLSVAIIIQRGNEVSFAGTLNFRAHMPSFLLLNSFL